jgi:hypothetical protein
MSGDITIMRLVRIQHLPYNCRLACHYWLFVCSALHALIVKKGGPIAATDVSLLELVQNRLSMSMQTSLSDCGGLLTWIRRQRTDDLCAISDKIMVSE